MTELKNTTIIKETEKAYLLGFTGYTTPKEANIDFDTMQMWFPKSKIKTLDIKFFVKNTQGFWRKKEIEIQTSLTESSLKKEEVEGVVLGGEKFYPSYCDFGVGFKNRDMSFFVSMKNKSPQGYYEMHRHAKGEDNFGKIFFVKAKSEFTFTPELKSSIVSFFYKKISHYGYSHNFLFKNFNEEKYS